MGERSPIYSDSRNYRIISVPNGLWQAQHKIADEGKREHDNWESVGHRPCVQLLAKQKMIAAGGILTE